MHVHVIRHAPIALLWKAGSWLKRIAYRMDSWLAVREKALDDSRVLEAMSERELRDIGIDPGRIGQWSQRNDWSI